MQATRPKTLCFAMKCVRHMATSGSSVSPIRGFPVVARFVPKFTGASASHGACQTATHRLSTHCHQRPIICGMSKRVAGRMILARNMRRLRLERDWSQERMAELSGLHRTYIGAVERGERNVSIDNIDRIARTFRMKISELLKQ